jgi:hypothetical protein
METSSERKELATLILIAVACSAANGLLIGYTSSPKLRIPSFDNDLSYILILLLIRWGGWAGAAVGLSCVILRAKIRSSLIALLVLVFGSSVASCARASCTTPDHWFDSFLLNLFICLVGAAAGSAIGLLVRRVIQRNS